MPRNRELNKKQHASLDRLAKKDPDARVVGWFKGVNREGPVINLSNGQQKVVAGSGYALPHPGV